MFMNTPLQTGSATKRRVLSRTIILFLLFAFCIGSAVPVISVQADEPAAAAAKEILTPIVEVQLPPGPICVRDEPYSILVTTFIDKDIPRTGNKVIHVSKEPSGGISVKGTSSDRSVGTITPPAQISGFDLDLNPGEAAFSFTALKAGSTVLTFKATFKRKVDQALKLIKVENCDYKVEMHASDIFTGSGVTIWTVGDLATTIKGENGELKGSGDFAFDSGFTGPPCSISYSQYDNPTTITGQVDNSGELVLNFQYQPGQITEDASCPGGGGTFTQSIDLTNTGIASATFPASGGTRSIRFTYAGSDAPPGTMIITVEPSEKAGG